jgi:hypothetical protein
MRRTFGVGLLFAVAMLNAVRLAVAQQDSNFNRVTTLRREVMGRTTGTDQDSAVSPREPASRGTNVADPLRPYMRAPGAPSSSQGNRRPQRALQPMPVQVRTTPHTFYPGMRSGQSVNRNVPIHRRSAQSRMGFMPFGAMNPVPSLGKTHR